MFSHFLGSRASVDITVAWENNTIIMNVVSSSSFFAILLLSMTSYGMDYLFCQFGSSVPAVSSPYFLPTPSLLTLDGCRGSEKVQELSATDITSVFYQHCFSLECKAHQNPDCYEVS